MHRPAPTSNRPAAASAAARALRAALALTLACTLCLPATALAAPDAGDAGTNLPTAPEASAGNAGTPTEKDESSATPDAAGDVADNEPSPSDAPQLPVQDKPAAPTPEPAAQPEEAKEPEGAVGATASAPTPQADEQTTAPAAKPTTNGPTRIHILAFDGISCDAILLESNGRFGMVDAGEDTDRPDGSDPRYPANRPFTSGADQGVERGHRLPEKRRRHRRQLRLLHRHSSS